MKNILSLLLLLSAVPLRAASPALFWFPANEIYFSAPFAQNIHYPALSQTAHASDWAFGYRAVGSGEGFGTTGGLQLQQFTVNSSRLGVSGSTYLLELLAGLEYISPKVENKPLRFNAGLVGNFGMSDTTFFMAPMLTAGLFYQPGYATQPSGLAFTLYYRLTEITLANAAGQPGALRPALGFRIGYIFKGFWAPKAKAAP